MTRRTTLGIRACTWVWLFMMGLTLTTYLIGQFTLGGLGVSLTVLAFALIKGQMVGDYFMGLKRVRGFWRWPVSLWLFLPGGLIGAAFALVG
ncbi:MAG: O-succinylhomoserine sulfhydrylase [gamma proteobacterium symbiont of Ctena orbiculata]|uniref:Cytochrome C oxidase subunit IV family protein n=1 Tax=Candidatus Thiodiazotropha taylori TaxID=2792791 RepID=A0A944MBY2_9GAMM|nr:cytochrome C oxidase subunit IV family protein [Candidatus Thiodiazotropha taylori]PUB90011.1 MAG: O-succinylhomoserine sulfhydrylase [gamma proteobacterium symbiont of Ctena orbiculata]MBT2991049.1 cytochrome C oxidase subunit IV family protein [Candidatus Thiodiazotropha taylori]MBT2996613.1 cytochrome C oxidase subunit IV family protein [Candidatus Thiodiazotropha taylori]MBT3000653.1 cytochrome C oxidase subunit IV family protein [Candidatus Thiodiazotropha taylori]